MYVVHAHIQEVAKVTRSFSLAEGWDLGTTKSGSEKSKTPADVARCRMADPNAHAQTHSALTAFASNKGVHMHITWPHIMQLSMCMYITISAVFSPMAARKEMLIQL